MRTRLALVVMLAVGGALDASTAARPAQACCAAPRAEGPRMVTPDGSTVGAGEGFVMYLSSWAQTTTITLVAEPAGAAPGGPGQPVTPPGAVPLGRRALAPHVFLLEVPAGTAPGAYGVWITPAPGDTSHGSQASRAARITIGTPPSTSALGPPSGTIQLVSTPGMRGASRRVELQLAGSPPPGVGVVFEWSDARGPHGNAQWLEPGRAPALAGEGRCGGYPFGVDLPPSGTAVRVAFVDGHGRLGPWATLTVR